MNGSRWCAYFGFRVFWIFFIRGRINCKNWIFRQISRKFTAHYGQNCGFWTNLGSFPKLVRSNKQYKNALLIYMAVFICFQALGPYIQLIYQPYIYCTIRHCHWYVFYKIGQWQEFESACYYRARTDFLYFRTGFSQDRFFLALVCPIQFCTFFSPRHY